MFFQRKSLFFKNKKKISSVIHWKVNIHLNRKDSFMYLLIRKRMTASKSPVYGRNEMKAILYIF